MIRLEKKKLGKAPDLWEFIHSLLDLMGLEEQDEQNDCRSAALIAET